MHIVNVCAFDFARYRRLDFSVGAIRKIDAQVLKAVTVHARIVDSARVYAYGVGKTVLREVVLVCHIISPFLRAV